MKSMKRLLGGLALALLVTNCGGPAAEQVSSESIPLFEEVDKIDVHAHMFVESPELNEMLRSSRLRIMNICVRGTNLEEMKLMEERAEKLYKEQGSLFPFASTFDLTRRNEDDYLSSVTEWLDRSYENGAVMTKIWKEVGMEIKNEAGEFILPDDPMFDPIYDHIEKAGRPLICHLAEPREAWQPLDPEGVHYGYYSTNPEWHFYGRDDVLSWETIIAARDNLLEKHPGLTVIGAHMGSMSHDVDLVAQRLDQYPNFYAECSARTKDLSRQPAAKVREFFEKYQDRLLYGTDIALRPAEDEATLRGEDKEKRIKSIEERYRLDFQYYAGTGTIDYQGKEVECLNLPLSILEKFYSKNAVRIIPGL